MKYNKVKTLNIEKPDDITCLPMALWLRRWISTPRIPCSKPLGSSKAVNAVSHPFEVNQMSSRNILELR